MNQEFVLFNGIEIEVCHINKKAYFSVYSEDYKYGFSLNPSDGDTLHTQKSDYKVVNSFKKKNNKDVNFILDLEKI